MCGARRPTLAEAGRRLAGPSGAASRSSHAAPRSSHAAPPLELLLYDNHHFAGNGKIFKVTDVLYRSATEMGVPFRVGSLVPASVRGWQSGDREEWLLQTLPKLTSRMVVLLDASDALLVCRRAELLQKLRKLLGTDGLAEGRGRVLVGAEQQLWPEDLYVHVPRARRQRSAGAPSTAKRRYPSPPMGGTRAAIWSSQRVPPPVPPQKGTPFLHINMPPQKGTPFLHINIGLLAGPPSTVLSLLRCMKRRYPDFPRQCPNARFINGSYEFVSDAPHLIRFMKLHGAQHVDPPFCDALGTDCSPAAPVTLATTTLTQPAANKPPFALCGRSLGLGAGMLSRVPARAGMMLIRVH